MSSKAANGKAGPIDDLLDSFDPLTIRTSSPAAASSPSPSSSSGARSPTNLNVASPTAATDGVMNLSLLQPTKVPIRSSASVINALPMKSSSSSLAAPPSSRRTHSTSGSLTPTSPTQLQINNIAATLSASARNTPRSSAINNTFSPTNGKSSTTSPLASPNSSSASSAASSSSSSSLTLQVPKKATERKLSKTTTPRFQGGENDSSSDEESEDDDDDDDDEEEEEEEEEDQFDKGEEGRPRRQTIPEKVEAKRTLMSLPGQARTRNTGPPTLNVNVLESMKKGTAFLKYGKHGYPHFRQFQLCDDNATIQWFSKGKKLSETCVTLFDVDELRLGQTTPNFARHSKEAAELNRTSFSLIYESRSTTLDLIAKDVNEYKIWVAGLTELLKKIQQGSKREELATMKSLVCEIVVHAGRRSSGDIKDFVTGKTADELASMSTLSEEGEDDDGKNKADSSSSSSSSLSSGDSDQPSADSFASAASGFSSRGSAEVAKSLSVAKMKLAKRKEELRLKQFYMSPAYTNMMVIVKRLDDSIGKIDTWFDDGDFQKCEDELWNANVDIEALENMMAAVRS